MASVWGELKRRNVVKVAVAYAIVGWLLIEVSTTVLPLFEAPDWIAQVFTFFVILGFPLALILSWAYELTPEGMKKSHEVEATESITHSTGRKLDFAIIGALVLALGFVVYNYVLEDGPVATSVLPDSVAVLPFENLSPDPNNAYFAAGIHEEVLNRLAKIGALNVIARTSMLQYAAGDKSIPQIAEELNVQTVMEGSVRYADDRVLVTAQLIDPQTSAHLWSDSYNRDLEDVFAIQADIAMNIANALEAEFSLTEQARIETVPTQSTRAWEFYLSARDYAEDPDEETGLPLAVQQYRRALEEDPDFAVAWAALSHVYSELQDFELAEEAVQRAFELVPDLPEGHFARAEIFYWSAFDYRNALEEYVIAEQGMPGDAEIISAQALAHFRLGQWQEAFAAWERARELDPRNVEEMLLRSFSYSVLREYAMAEEFLDQVLEIAPDTAAAYVDKVSISIWRDGDVGPARALLDDPPIDLGERRQGLGWYTAIYEREYMAALSYLDEWELDLFDPLSASHVTPTPSYYGVTYQLLGQPNQALTHFQAAREVLEAALNTSPDNPRLHIALGEVLAGFEEREAAVESGRRAIELMPMSVDVIRGSYVLIEAILRVFIPAGDYEAAIDELDAYLAGPGWRSIEGLLPDPRLDPVRDDPRFQVLVEKYRRP